MGDDMTDAVGFIGLGNIGAPMASRLLEWSGGLVVFDVRAEACAPYVERGATAASGPDGILSRARPGTVVAVHSTISAEGAVALAEVASAAGVDLVDAPVSGGAMGAHGGTLAFMIGGPEDAVEKCRGPFGLMASLICHFGPVGAGTHAKIARNLVTFASYAVVGEASRLAEAAGLDLVRLGEVVRHSDRVTGGPGAIMLRPTAAPMAADDGLRPIFGHTATLGGKDLHLAVDMAAALGVNAPFAALAEERLSDALGLGDPDGAA
jgi:3-hydroxyisobutyrate dehydrogenase